MKNIGLFPIKNVLFPDSILPVHVFEERYIKLINSAKHQDKIFGINLKNAGKIHEYGCIAQISKVIKHFDDGKMDVLLKGGQRYRILNRARGQLGFDNADIELMQNKIEIFSNDLLLKCISMYNNLIEKIHTRDINKIDREKLNTNTPSYYFAQKSGLNIKQKYQLLLLDHEDDRLDYIIDHLENILPIVKEAEIVSKIIKNDGYYNPG